MASLRSVVVFASFLLSTPAHAGVVEDWNDLLTNFIFHNQVASPNGTRMLATLHNAQWKAVRDYAKKEGRNVYDTRTSDDPSFVRELEAAAASAAHHVVHNFTINQTTIDAAHDLLMRHMKVKDGSLKSAVDTGADCANVVLSERAKDHADVTPHIPDYYGSNETGKWRPVPPKFAPQTAGILKWANVTPFFIASPSSFRVPPPPGVDSRAYSIDYNEVFEFGRKNSSVRTSEQTEAVAFWDTNAEVTWSHAVKQVTANRSVVDAARIFAVASAAMFDARMATMDSKLYYQRWRPVSAIRTNNSAGLPTDPQWQNWVELGAFPEYPAGHASTAAAAATVLKNVTGSDDFAFTIESPVAPGKPRSFTSFRAASAETSDARVWGGEHFRVSVIQGTQQGIAVGQRVLELFAEQEHHQNQPSRRKRTHLRQ